ncbi:ABC-type polar amino acid transport system ATPase subunit [Sinorhizobium fredii]|uniref:Uncharacterized protein n=1 Tax=Sinorhizobium fredii (strain USDA 257) TaxID=1185652 RepID=I3X5C1_SINF2|nr:hypothetical protein USDA257_c25010 [Sinorhizobium fredii USDA 257]
MTHEMGFARRVATQTIFMHKGKIWGRRPRSSPIRRRWNSVSS